MSTLTLAIIGNLVGDYLLQNDWMALRKKNHWFPCVVHCLIWTVCVSGFAGWYKSPMSIPAAIVLFTTHFIQDHTTIVKWWMLLVGQEKFLTGPCAPWSVIVVDNVWHIFTIALVASLVIR